MSNTTAKTLEERARELDEKISPDTTLCECGHSKQFHHPYCHAGSRSHCAQFKSAITRNLVSFAQSERAEIVKKIEEMRDKYLSDPEQALSRVVESCTALSVLDDLIVSLRVG